MSPSVFPPCSHTSTIMSTPLAVQVSNPFPQSQEVAKLERPNSHSTRHTAPLPGSLHGPEVAACTVSVSAKPPCQWPSPLPQLARGLGTGETTPPEDILDLFASGAPPTPFQHANFDLEFESPGPIPFMNGSEEFDS